MKNHIFIKFMGYLVKSTRLCYIYAGEHTLISKNFRFDPPKSGKVRLYQHTFTHVLIILLSLVWYISTFIDLNSIKRNSKQY